MQSIPETPLLKFRPDTLKVVRSEVNLDSEERVKEAIIILEVWIKKQAHFVMSDYSKDYLEKTIVISKGLVERAKQRMDKLCTLRTLMPEFFTMEPDFRASYERMGQRLPSAFMPNLTKASRRILLLKVTSDYDSKDINTFFKIATMYGEYLRCNEYCSGFEVIVDYRYGNIINHIAHINPIALKQIATIALEGYGFRIKGIHLVTSSKAISLFVNLLKQVISAKLFSRINVIQNIEDLYEYVPQELMPFEYGGKEKSLKELHGRDYLERTIVIAKGHVEGAKQRLDKLCTLRTLMPDVFTPSPDLKSVFERIGQRLPHAFLPTLTKKSCRLFLLKIAADFEANDVYNFYKMAAMYVEYLRKHDYSSGNRLILDYRHANIVNQIPNINPLDMKQIATIIFEGYGLRIKGLYVISPSKAIRLFVAIVKQALSKKLASRLHVLRDIKELYEIVPQELMPREYGGKEKPLKELYDEWCNTVSGEKFQAYYKEMREAATVEARRPPDMFNEQHLGLSGSFRVLTVD